MALSSRIRELANRHRDLETRIQAELSRPASNEAQLRELKRRKLKIKDEMAVLRARDGDAR